MNLKTTLMLIVLAGAGVLLWWYGTPPLPPTLEPAPRTVAVEDKGTRDFLQDLRPDKIQRLEIHAPSGITELTHKADGQWALPGNWPVRRLEVENLVGLLSSLRSRFEPTPLHEDKDLPAFGLDHPAVSVTIRTQGEEHTLAFGEPPADSLENRFSHDTYVRLDRRDEAVRLAPGLITALDKPTDYYQERRLFQKETISGEDSRDSSEQLQARSLTVDDNKAGGANFTLVRSGKSWKDAELAEPVRDRLDDDARKSVLAGVLDLWAEQFVPAGSGGVSPWLWHAHTYWDAASSATDLFFATQGGLLVRAGLTNPERVITAKSDKGDTTTLLIGSVSSRRQRLVPAPQQPGMMPGMQQQRMMPVTEEYRYAKLLYNDQIFEIKVDKLKDVFVSLDKLRDSRIARFNSSDVRRIEIKHRGEDIVMGKDKDNWKLVKPFSAEADNAKVTELLNKLSDLQARDKDIIDKSDPKKFGFDKPAAVVKITVEEESKGNDRRDPAPAEKKTRTIAVHVGKRDVDKKKLYVMADDWPRINAVDDSLAPLVQRSALAYRGKRLFDFNAAEVAKLEIDNQGKKLVLERSPADTSTGGATWRLAKPVNADADPARVDQLLGDLGHLEAAEFVAEEPKKDDLETQYSLGKPPLTVRVEFKDKKQPAKEVQIGKTRGGKGGFFARMSDGGPVFAINEDLHKQLTRDSLSYRPQTLWQLLPEEIEFLRVRKAGQKEYLLSRSESVWKISGPFEANALGETVQKMTSELTAPKADSYTAHEAKNLAEYGLDKPLLTVSIKPVLGKDDSEHTLMIGKTVRSHAEHGNEGGSHYAKRGNDAAIFTVNDALVRAADRAALDLLDTKLLSLDAAKVERLRCQVGDKSLTLERSHAERGNERSGWEVTESPAGAYPADAEAVTSLSPLWSDLRAQRFADYGKGVAWDKYGLEKPAARITIREGKSEHVIQLGKPVDSEAGARYARVDQSAGVAVLTPETVRLLERNYLDYVKHDLLKFDAAAVAALQRRIGTEVLELAKKDDGWNVVKPAKEKADDQVIQQLFEQVGKLRAERVAAYPYPRSRALRGNEGDVFALDKPAALISIKLKGDQKTPEHTIKLGKAAGKNGERFALVDDSKVVAVLPGPLVEQLMGASLAFRDRTIARFGAADRLQLERGPRHAVYRKIDGSWKLTEPLQGDAEQDLLDDFLGRLNRLRASALVAEKPDADAMKKYGLDRPEATWRAQSGDKEVLNLLIGNKEAKGERRYAKLAKGELVFLLDPQLSQKVLDEYRPRTVWSPPLDAVEIESLNYRYNRTPFMLEKRSHAERGNESAGWQAVGKPGAKLNAATVEDTLAALAGLKLSRYAVDKDANLALFGLDKPELILEIATRSGKRVLHIGNSEGSSKGRYARIAETTQTSVFVLDEETCVRIMRDLSAFGRPPTRSTVQPAAR